MVPTDRFQRLRPLPCAFSQHVRDFVAGDAFDALLRFAQELAQSQNGCRFGGKPPIAAARSPGSVPVHDLRGPPRTTARGDSVPQGPEPKAEDLSPFLDDLVALTQAAAQFENDDAMTSLTEIVTEMTKARADPPGEGEEKPASEA
jgi:hypothetical protein